MVVQVKLEDSVNLEELRKALCFVSEEILTINMSKNSIELELSEGSDSEEVVNKVQNLIFQYKKINNTNCELWNNFHNQYQFEDDIINDRQLFHVFSDGLLELRGKAIFLYDYFEKSFANIADEMGALRKFYPVLLPIEEYVKTGYIKRSPQYAMFCSNANENMEKLEHLSDAVSGNRVKKMLDEPRLALSPSACFHVYAEYQGMTLRNNVVVSFTQNVFRNEGRLNYSEIGRLKDYHVREIVFIGNDDYVNAAREEVMEKTKSLVNQWDVQACIKCASDPFVLPKMQKYRNIQLIDSSKYEICLRMGNESELAAASFNYHGTAFTYPFKIKMSNCVETVTGCAGFGIERWVIAFLTQFGSDVNNWPKCIQEEYIGSGANKYV